MPHRPEVPQPVAQDRPADSQIHLCRMDHLVRRTDGAGSYQLFGVIAAQRAVRSIHIERSADRVAAHLGNDVDDRRSHLRFTEVAEARDHQFVGLNGVGAILRRTRRARSDADAIHLEASRLGSGAGTVGREAGIHRRHQGRRDPRGCALERHLRENFLVEHLRLSRSLDVDSRALAGDRDRFFQGPDAQLSPHRRHDRARQLESFPLDGIEARQRERHRINARRKIDDAVLAVAIGDAGAHLLNQHGARHFNRHAWQDGVG